VEDLKTQRLRFCKYVLEERLANNVNHSDHWQKQLRIVDSSLTYADKQVSLGNTEISDELSDQEKSELIHSDWRLQLPSLESGFSETHPLFFPVPFAGYGAAYYVYFAVLDTRFFGNNGELIAGIVAITSLVVTMLVGTFIMAFVADKYHRWQWNRKYGSEKNISKNDQGS